MYEPPSQDETSTPSGATEDAHPSIAPPITNGAPPRESDDSRSHANHHDTQSERDLLTHEESRRSLEALVLAMSKEPLENDESSESAVAVVHREQAPKGTFSLEKFFGETLPDLPPDLVLEIFYRLTIGELLRIRSVRKAWKAFAENPYLWRVHLQANHASLTRGRLWQFLFDTPLPDIHYRYSRELFRIEIPPEQRVSLRALYESANQYNLVPRPFNQQGKGYNLDYSILFLHPENQNLAKLDETVQCLYREGQNFEVQVSTLAERARALIPWRAPIAKSDFFKILPSENYFNLALYLLSARHIENIFCVLEILRQIQALMRHNPRGPNEAIHNQYASTRTDILQVVLNSQYSRNLTGRGLLIIDATIPYVIKFLIDIWIDVQSYIPGSSPTNVAQYRAFMTRTEELFNRLSMEDLSTYVDYGYEHSAIVVAGLKAHHPVLLAKVNQSILLRAAKNIRSVTGENNDCIVNDPLLLNKLDDNHFIMIARHVSSRPIPHIFKDGTPFRNRLDSFLTPHGISSFVMRLFESSEERTYIACKYAEAALNTKAYLDALSDEQITYILTTIKTGASLFDTLLKNALFIERLSSYILFRLATTSFAYLSGLLENPHLIAEKLTPEHAFLIAKGNATVKNARPFYDHFHSQWSREQLLALYNSLKDSGGFTTSDFQKVMAREYGERIRQEQLIIHRQEEQAKKEQAAREHEQRLHEQKERGRQAQNKVLASPISSAPNKAPLRSPYTSLALRKRITEVAATPNKAIESPIESFATPNQPFDWMTFFIVVGAIVGMGLILTGILTWAGVSTVASAFAPLALKSGLSLTTTSQLFGAIGFLFYTVSAIIGVNYNSEKLRNSHQQKQKTTSSKPLPVIPQKKLGINSAAYVYPLYKSPTPATHHHTPTEGSARQNRV